VNPELIVTVAGAAEKWGLAGVLHTVLTSISGFHRSTRALTQAEPHLAVAPEQLQLLLNSCVYVSLTC